MSGAGRTPLGELFMSEPSPCDACTPDAPCADHAPQPGDEELGRALLRMWGDQIVARCIDPNTLLRGMGAPR